MTPNKPFGFSDPEVSSFPKSKSSWRLARYTTVSVLLITLVLVVVLAIRLRTLADSQRGLEANVNAVQTEVIAIQDALRAMKTQSLTFTLTPTATPAIQASNTPFPTLLSTFTPVPGTCLATVAVNESRLFETPTENSKLVQTLIANTQLIAFGSDAEKLWIQVYLANEPTISGWIRTPYIEFAQPGCEIGLAIH